MIFTKETSWLGFSKILSFYDLEDHCNWKMPTLNSHSHFFGLQEGEGNEAASESDECILYAFDAQFHGWPY
jgi:hypothetical protein